jgi:hypothetical protein
MHFHVPTENGVAMISWYSISLTISTILMMIKVCSLLYWPHISLTLQCCRQHIFQKFTTVFQPLMLLKQFGQGYHSFVTTIWSVYQFFWSLTRWRCSPLLKVISFVIREHSKFFALLWLTATEMLHICTKYACSSLSTNVAIFAWVPEIFWRFLYPRQSNCLFYSVKFPPACLNCKCHHLRRNTFLYLGVILHHYYTLTASYLQLIQQTAISYSPKIWYYYQTEIFFLTSSFTNFLMPLN